MRTSEPEVNALNRVRVVYEDVKRVVRADWKLALGSLLHLTSALLLMLVASSHAFASADLFTSFQQALQKNEATGFASLLLKAQEALVASPSSEKIEYVAKQASCNTFASTIKFTQVYRGIEVFGNEAAVHFSPDGTIHDINQRSLETKVDTTPKVTSIEALRLLSNHQQKSVVLNKAPELKIYKDAQGNGRLVYQLSTKLTNTLIDAHSGEIVLESNRVQAFNEVTEMPITINALEASEVPQFGGFHIVYSANTSLARSNINPNGEPSKIKFDWYIKLIDNSSPELSSIERPELDRSAQNAYINSNRIYEYFRNKFGRRSYDNKDSAIVSVIHLGEKMNNAFWMNQGNFIAYGDGDGDKFGDLTYGLDVAAHEFTHGIIKNTSDLATTGESGALGESYADFFGKMVDYTPGDWYIGKRVVSPRWGSKGLRNMLNPEEFGQPGSTDSPIRSQIEKSCVVRNDRCGMHKIAGIPNRAAALIVELIGKQKTEQLFYEVLTERLTATSDFHDARVQTERACSMMFGGYESAECKAVRKAYDTVKM